MSMMTRPAVPVVMPATQTPAAPYQSQWQGQFTSATGNLFFGMLAGFWQDVALFFQRCQDFSCDVMAETAYSLSSLMQQFVQTDERRF